ncbi:MAG TPA: ATP-binding protein [Planctomycetaceae bacterium]|nr:ATP-binding protein [Planctomycetaceae bacterium]
MNADSRVLVLMPTLRDAERTRDALGRAGVECAICRSMADLCAGIEAGAGAAILTEEAIVRDRDGCLSNALDAQPAWSQFPLVVLAREGAEERGIREWPNATLVERPIKLRSLLSVVRAALRSRQQQYAIRDYLAERERMEAELRQADRQKDDFIALLAHELRNPLAPIRNGLQVLRLAPTDVNAVAQARGMMDRQLSHMVRLIDDLLDVSRISRNKMELRKERILLADVVANAVETARPLIEAAGHELVLTLPADPIFLDADPTRLAQVLGNLLANSAKYTEAGGRIRFTAERVGSELVLRVQDNGIGIPAEALASIFDMFSQVDRSIERSAGGLGIGLALVKGIVEMHGGTVAVESPGRGQGATFTIRLPILDDQPTAQNDADSRPEKPRHARRVLVVDDNADSAATMAMMLRLLGDEVEQAHDGLAALETAETFRPEVILMDVGMPRLNGLDATRRIRSEPWGQEIAIIALTGWGQEDDKERSRAAGCNGHLVKPVSLPDLERVMAEQA